MHKMIVKVIGAAMHSSEASGAWLGIVDDFRTANWLALVKYPELVMQQVQQFLQMV